ncbi:MAG: hypothetical protein ACQESB_05240, partial [Elusimicrobiota bacterium]
KSFRYKESGEEDFGLIAEDLDELELKNLVVYDEKGRPDDINRNGITFYLLEVIKKQQGMLESQQAQIDELIKQIDNISR